MNNNNTKLVNALLKGEDISEIFRAEVEKAILYKSFLDT